MSLSIITPHFNDLEGLKRVYACLQEQNLADWDWVIVDDKSDDIIKNKVQNWFSTLQDKRVQLLFSEKKTNASVCRNLGVDLAKRDHLVFLDADDNIAPDFVANRNRNFTDFAVFMNYAILNEKGEKIIKKYTHENYLNNFLAAKFLWQTTCVLWSRSFFMRIGKFDSELLRLQDVEISIRAMQQSSKFSVVNNTVDFFYKTKPISERNNLVPTVCNAVYLFISKLLQTDNLSKQQCGLVSGYYFLCIRYVERSGSRNYIGLVQRNLNLFYKKKYIGFIKYIIGYILLKIYKCNLLSGNQFMRFNRFLFKPNHISVD